MAFTFADWVQGHRKQRRWSQGELARRLGMHRSYISRIEGGAIQLPELETRRRFHEVFGTEESDLEAYGIVPNFDEWGRVVPPSQWEELALSPDLQQKLESEQAASRANPYDPADLRWQIVEAMRPLDVTDPEAEWLLQMILRELRRDDVPRVPNLARRTG